MLKKIIKYDLKWINKILVIFYIILLFLSLILRVIETLEMTNIVIIIDKILIGTLISGIISCIFNSLIRFWVLFINTMYKDQSYLTHTLPVSRKTVYDGKLLSGLISLVTSFIIIFICILILFIGNDKMDLIKNIFDALKAMFGSNTSISIIISFIIMIVLEVMEMLQFGVFGIILGHKSNSGKIIKAIVIGVVSYNMTQTLMLGIIYIISMFNSGLGELFKTGMPSSNSMILFVYIAMSLYILFNIILYFLNRKLISKGVDVD